MILLTAEPIDVARVMAHVQRPEAGAVVLFLGTTRQYTDGRETVELSYEAYAEMAEKELTRLAAEAERRWPLTACAVVHRVGVAPVGEASVAVAVSSPHRDAAFEAGRWLIDSLKATAPIWKKEHWADGGCDWIHPGKADVR
jgi:molybdopterin synthase catalytic subunit